MLYLSPISPPSTEFRKIPWKHRHSAEMGKFRSSAQNYAFCEKLVSNTEIHGNKARLFCRFALANVYRLTMPMFRSTSLCVMIMVIHKYELLIFTWDTLPSGYTLWQRNSVKIWWKLESLSPPSLPPAAFCLSLRHCWTYLHRIRLLHLFFTTET